MPKNEQPKPRITLKSMTGFGCGMAKEGEWSVRCEIRTVNHRGREIKCRLPRDFSPLEIEIQNIVQKVFHRGRIEVSVWDEKKAGTVTNVTFHSEIAVKLLEQLEKFASRFESISAEIRLGEFFLLRELFEFHENPNIGTVKILLLKALKIAAHDVGKAREAEGKNICFSLQKSLKKIHRFVVSLSEREKKSGRERFLKLNNRIKEIVCEVSVDNSRIAQEAALLAEKSDIIEEIERMESHCHYFKRQFVAKESVGRKLNFVCQEMLRESNTIASKCWDGKGVEIAIELRAEIERMREQVQNIE